MQIRWKIFFLHFKFFAESSHYLWLDGESGSEDRIFCGCLFCLLFSLPLSSFKGNKKNIFYQILINSFFWIHLSLFLTHFFLFFIDYEESLEISFWSHPAFFQSFWRKSTKILLWENRQLQKKKGDRRIKDFLNNKFITNPKMGILWVTKFCFIRETIPIIKNKIFHIGSWKGSLLIHKIDCPIHLSAIWF